MFKVKDNRERNEAKRKKWYQNEDAHIDRKAANPGYKTAVGTLYSHLVNLTAARETIATGKNNNKAEDKTYEKQSRITLHQEWLHYLIKV